MDEILRAPQEEFPLHTQRKGRAPSAQGGREKAERAGERFRKLMEAGDACSGCRASGYITGLGPLLPGGPKWRRCHFWR